MLRIDGVSEKRGCDAEGHDGCGASHNEYRNPRTGLECRQRIPGLAYITEMNISMEGTGQIAMMMQQLGTMKVTNKTVSVSVDPIADDLFTVPPDYKIIQ